MSNPDANERVYVPETPDGRKRRRSYHLKATCNAVLRLDSVEETTLGAAVQVGHTPCEWCSTDDSGSARRLSAEEIQESQGMDDEQMRELGAD